MEILLASNSHVLTICLFVLGNSIFIFFKQSQSEWPIIRKNFEGNLKNRVKLIWMFLIYGKKTH